jgi:predicted secreted protein
MFLPSGAGFFFWYAFFISVPYNKIAFMATIPQEIVQLEPGAQHVVRLKGLSAAGYEWVYENSNEKTAGVQKTFDPPADHVGASAAEIFTITALHAGEVILTFRQVRTWEPGKPPREEKVLKVSIG